MSKIFKNTPHTALKKQLFINKISSNTKNPILKETDKDAFIVFRKVIVMLCITPNNEISFWPNNRSLQL